MTWTKTPPKTDGWYWRRNSRGAAIVRVFRCLTTDGTEYFVVGNQNVNSMTACEWSSEPVPEPKEE